MAKYLAGDKCTQGDLKWLSTDYFWTWAKSDGLAYYRDAYLVLEKCVEFEKDVWFGLGEAMWRNHWSVFQDHLKFIRNDIVKPFRVGTLQSTKRVQEMHNLSKHLPPLLMKVNGYEAANWKLRDK